MKDKEILNVFIEAGLVELPDILPDAKWFEGSELMYNTDGCEEDLLNGDGESYSGYIKERDVLGDYVIFKIDSQQGFDYQVILSLENKVDEE